MNHFDKDEIPMLSESPTQRSDEPQDSTFRRNISSTRSASSSTRSASISIPMASLDQYERQPNLVRHTGPLRTARKTPLGQMSGPLYATPATGNPFQNSIVVAGKKVGENKTEKFDGTDEHRWNDNDYDKKNEHLLRSGQLGMCSDPYCTTCPTYFKVSQQTNQRASVILDPKFHNSLYGDAKGDTKGYGRKLYSFCSSCIPGVMNPHNKVVQHWNKFLAIFCLVAIFVDPLFFFLIYVNKDEKCICINWTMANTLVSIRSITDIVYFLNILLQFRLAYVSPDSRVVGAGDLVDHPKKIALNYIKSYFFFDLFVVAPLPEIMIFFILPISLGLLGANYTKNILRLAILVQYIPRLFRFLPLLIGQSPTGFIFESAWANFIINLLIFMLSGHVVGSCWYLFGLQRVNQCLRDACHLSELVGCKELIDCDANAPNETAPQWRNNTRANDCLNPTSGVFAYGIYGSAVQLTIETRVINKYVYALFWGFQQISTLAGNQTPSYFVWEVLFTMSIIGLGLLLFALLIGNIQNFLQSLGRRRLEMQLRGRDVEQWMSHHRLPEDLKRRVRQAERYSWAATKGVPEKMVLNNLPEDLQTDIRRHLFKFVKSVRIFSLMDEDEPILDAIRERLIQTTYIKGSKILSQGGLVQKMVFIVRGKLESIGEDGIPVPLTEGDACGEELLRWYLEQSSESKECKKVKLQGQGLTSDRTVRCLTNVEAFSLRTKDIEEVTTLFARFLRSPRVQGVIRYESPYWKSLAANRIQVAWRYRKKRLNRATTT
ncbi:probable cyclic nucleotide-gated ion channel 20, chloroplastic [Trifolium pratense]|uniref:probable cyclic nucleotide-gated ion channel 20, chloroplastic n=1 Tax=Trifolium pratense TaxID=57577 RepID=UPI001E692940|nr:probable cyclic nucleotide-gated ion channel 20, chloroplastic [Trifolium pratense]XP_045817191.1 probable cyclic nucleotide-gated ion channel 20, chloroplastic [Trifolium pratense]